MIQKPNQGESQAPQPKNEIQQEVGRNSGQSIGQLDNGQAVNLQNVQNVTFQQNGSSSSQIPQTPFKKKLPPLLPYLANRKEQESQLGETFLKFLKQDSPGHLVCIVHGDESQCHHNFLERIQTFALPKWLEIHSHPSISNKTYQLEWPSKLKNLHELRNELYKSLAKGVLGNSFYSFEKINDYLNNYPEPIILYTTLLTEDLQKQEFEILNKLLEFCHHLHETVISQKLIIYISIKYKNKRYKSAKKVWIKWIFSFARGFYKQYRCQQINKRVRQYLQKLANSNLNHFQPLSVIVLPELEGINQGEVENWVRSEDTRKLVGEAMIEPLIQRVGEMFEFWEEETYSDTIPMHDLSEKLVELVKLLLQDESA